MSTNKGPQKSERAQQQAVRHDRTAWRKLEPQDVARGIACAVWGCARPATWVKEQRGTYMAASGFYYHCDKHAADAGVPGAGPGQERP